MIRDFLLSLAILFLTFNVFAQDDIVQGPFNVDNASYVYVKKEKDANYPLSLYFKKDDLIRKIDDYEVNGDTPRIESIFFMTIEKKKNVIVLVSWRQEHRAENILGQSYQIYGYIYNGKTLLPNNKITNDPNLSGEEGEYNGDELHFKYKDAASIKRYLKNKY